MILEKNYTPTKQKDLRLYLINVTQQNIQRI